MPPQHGEAVLVPDVSKDPRYIEANPETRSELCIPLIYKDKVIGVLDIEHTRRGYFNEDHVRIMTTMAAQVAIAIENATLYERIARQEKRLEQDLALARELQFRLLPQKLPGAQERRGRLALCARAPDWRRSLRLPEVQRTGRDRHRRRRRQRQRRAGRHLRRAGQRHCAFPRRGRTERGRTCWRQSICRFPSVPIEGQYVSMIYAIWDDNQQTLQLANSGLPRPLHCRDGKAEEIQATGLPIGLFNNATYDELTVQARAAMSSCSSATAFWTPPARRARCSAAAVWKKWCRTIAVPVPKRSVDAIFKAVSTHAEGVEAFDDQTIVVLKVKGPIPKK